MAGEKEPGDRPEGGPDDLFEDLDKFFASIDESEWPDAEPVEEEQEAAAPAPAPTPPAHEPEESEPAWDESDQQLIEAAEPDQPGEDWEVPAEADELLPAEPPEEPLLPEAPPVPAGSGPTREMTTEDWARLRDVLGEDDEEEEFQFTDVPTELGPSDLSPEESLFGYPDQVQAEPVIEQEQPGSWESLPAEGAEMGAGPEPPPEPDEGELTLDDLKKAPPEYEELPTEDVLELTPAGTGDAGPSETETFEMPEPSLADVEAAADHLAEEFQAPPGAVDDDLLADLGAPEPAPPRRTVKVGEPESLVGPSWEDPTSQTVTTGGTEPPAQPARNLPVAVVTGAGLAVGALIAVFIAKWLFALVAGAVILFGQLELYTSMQRRDYQPATVLGLVLGGFTLAAAYARGEAAMTFMLVLGLVLSFLWYMAGAPKARTNVIGNVGATLLGLAYVPFLAGYIFVILTAGDSGRSLMLAILGLTFLNDIAAFGFGSIWGSRPLAPTVSPRKSLEGLLGGTFVTILLAIAFVPSIDGMTVVRSVGLAIVVCVFAPLGDLSESLLKRDLGVKDMGNVLPGHGGVLDRIDSALFVAPAAFYFLRLIF
jgi:phosphatidate cytidylyltransferase